MYNCIEELVATGCCKSFKYRQVHQGLSKGVEDKSVSITRDSLNVMFGLGCFSATWCWRLQGLAGKGGPIFPQAAVHALSEVGYRSNHTWGWLLLQL